MDGGVMAASLWKSKAEKANKLLGQPRASEAELQNALYDLQNFKWESYENQIKQNQDW